MSSEKKVVKQGKTFVDYPHRLSVAPMMDWTDRHCRVLHRLMSRRAMLYTEMVTAPAIVHGPKARLLDYSDVEHPVACNLAARTPPSLPLRSGLPIPGAMTRSTSTAAARRTGCSPAALVRF